MLKAEKRARKGGVTNPEDNNADLTELEDLVEAKGLVFGMNVSKYKLDKD